jgi:hypothetical protein
MIDKRLVERIELARRELHIAEGVANEEELRAGALDQQMEEFRNHVNASLDLPATYLLGIEFARDQEGPVARLTADEIGFELRQGDGHNLILRESDSKRVLMPIVAGDPQSANRIVCAIADSLAAARQSA